MQNHFFIKKNNLYHVKIDINDISHIIVNGDCSILHTTIGKFPISISLKALSKKLSGNFIRTNRNVIVNNNHISKISYRDRSIELENGFITQISVRRIKTIKLHLEEKTLGHH